MKKCYFIVKWRGHVRISFDKHDNIVDACFDCYGMVATDMKIKNIGGVKSKIQSDKWFQQQLNSDENWVSPEKDIYIRKKS